MFNLKLYLGFFPDPAFQKELEKANPYLLSTFIGKEEYLLEVTQEGKKYLAKPLPAFPTLDQLENSEKNLISLLSRLAPQYPFSKNPPVLLTVS